MPRAIRGPMTPPSPLRCHRSPDADPRIGVLIECDPSIKSIIVNIDSSNHEYIIEDLDDQRVVVKENMVGELKRRLEEVRSEARACPTKLALTKSNRGYQRRSNPRKIQDPSERLNICFRTRISGHNSSIQRPNTARFRHRMTPCPAKAAAHARGQRHMLSQMYSAGANHSEQSISEPQPRQPLREGCAASPLPEL